MPCRITSFFLTVMLNGLAGRAEHTQHSVKFHRYHVCKFVCNLIRVELEFLSLSCICYSTVFPTWLMLLRVFLRTPNEPLALLLRSAQGIRQQTTLEYKKQFTGFSRSNQLLFWSVWLVSCTCDRAKNCNASWIIIRTAATVRLPNNYRLWTEFGSKNGRAGDNTLK